MMATTDCGYGKIVSVAFVKQEYTQTYKWFDESYFYEDRFGNTGSVCCWTLKRLIICQFTGSYWRDVASLTKKP